MEGKSRLKVKTGEKQQISPKKTREPKLKKRYPQIDRRSLPTEDLIILRELVQIEKQTSVNGTPTDSTPINSTPVNSTPGNATPVNGRTAMKRETKNKTDDTDKNIPKVTENISTKESNNSTQQNQKIDSVPIHNPKMVKPYSTRTRRGSVEIGEIKLFQDGVQIKPVYSKSAEDLNLKILKGKTKKEDPMQGIRKTKKGGNENQISLSQELASKGRLEEATQGNYLGKSKKVESENQLSLSQEVASKGRLEEATQGNYQGKSKVESENQQSLSQEVGINTKWNSENEDKERRLKENSAQSKEDLGTPSRTPVYRSVSVMLKEDKQFSEEVAKLQNKQNNDFPPKEKIVKPPDPLPYPDSQSENTPLLRPSPLNFSESPTHRNQPNNNTILRGLANDIGVYDVQVLDAQEYYGYEDDISCPHVEELPLLETLPTTLSLEYSQRARTPEPRVPEPRVPEPRVLDHSQRSRAPDTRVPEPRVLEPPALDHSQRARTPEPRVPDPRVPEPRVLDHSQRARTPESRVPEPRPMEHSQRSRAPELRALESRGLDTHTPGVSPTEGPPRVIQTSISLQDSNNNVPLNISESENSTTQSRNPSFYYRSRPITPIQTTSENPRTEREPIVVVSSGPNATLLSDGILVKNGRPLYSLSSTILSQLVPVIFEPGNTMTVAEFAYKKTGDPKSLILKWRVNRGGGIYRCQIYHIRTKSQILPDPIMMLVHMSNIAVQFLDKSQLDISLAGIKLRLDPLRDLENRVVRGVVPPDLRVQIRGPEECHGLVALEEDGKLVISANPQKEGRYMLQCYFKGQPVLGHEINLVLSEEHVKQTYSYFAVQIHMYGKEVIRLAQAIQTYNSNPTILNLDEFKAVIARALLPILRLQHDQSKWELLLYRPASVILGLFLSILYNICTIIEYLIHNLALVREPSTRRQLALCYHGLGPILGDYTEAAVRAITASPAERRTYSRDFEKIMADLRLVLEHGHIILQAYIPIGIRPPDDLTGIDIRREYNPVTIINKLVDFLDSERARQISLRIICGEEIPPQNLEGSVKMIHRIVKPMVDLLKEPRLDPSGLLYHTARGILFLRYIGKKHMTRPEDWNRFVPLVEQFSRASVRAALARFSVGSEMNSQMTQLGMVLAQIRDLFIQ